jgi:hypothetical protein
MSLRKPHPSNRRCLYVFCTILALCPLLSPQAADGQASNPVAHEIRGVVTDCWQGERYPVKNLRVYVLTIKKSERIRGVLQRIKNLPPGADRETVEQFSKLADELVEETKKLVGPAAMRKTNRNGEFWLSGIRAGQKYLVLAISWEKEDEIAYFTYVITDILRSDLLDLKLYMGPNEKQDCRLGK